MAQMTSATGSLPLRLSKGETLVIKDLAGSHTVTGSLAPREDASASVGAGFVVYGPQPSAATVTISTTGAVDYQVVSGDVTPAPASVGGAVFFAEADESSILSKVALAQAAGGGTVVIPPGEDSSGNWTTIPLTAPLPWVSGVSYEGTRPVTTPTTGAPDLGISITGGTVFVGNGTFPGIWDGMVDQPTPFDIPIRSVNGANVRNLGFINFSNALRAGANPVIYGLFNCTIDGIWAKDCTSDSYYFNNFQHCEFKNLYDDNCAHGPWWTGNGGNSVIDNIFSAGPQNNLYSKGIRFDSPHPTGWLNFIAIGYIQRNLFGRVAITVSAGFTNASSNVTVPDGTKFAIGMPWKLPSGSAFGNLQADRIIYVRSISFNSGTTGPATITFATDLSRSDVHSFTAATGNYDISSAGFPFLSVTKGPNGSSTSPGGNTWTGYNQSGLLFRAVDLEGIATCQIDVQYSSCVIGQTNNAFTAIDTYPMLHMLASNVTYGGSEASVYCDGPSMLTPQPGMRVKRLFPGSYSPAGFWVDTSTGGLGGVLSLSRDVPAGQGNFIVTYANATNYAYAQRGIAQRTTYNGSSSRSGVGDVGDNHYTDSGGVAAVWALRAPPSDNTFLGAPMNFFNDSPSNTLTINVIGGGQPFSNITGRTSYVLQPGQYLCLKFAYRGFGNGYYSVTSTNGTPNV